MKIQKLRRIIGVVCVGSVAAFFAFHSSAAPTSAPAPKLIGEWVGGTQVNLCSTGVGRCVTAEFPAEIGTPKKLVDGDFVKASPLSWIVLSKKNTSLCAVSSASPSIDCVVLSDNFQLSDLHVSRDVEGGYRWDLRSKKGGTYVESKVNKFLAAFNVARDALEARQKAISKGTASGGGMMHIEECDCAQPGDGGGDAGGGGGGDAGGGGGDTTPTNGEGEGQVIVITGPKPPPPLTDPTEPPLTTPDPGFWCGTLGINCPGVPKVPDPVP